MYSATNNMADSIRVVDEDAIKRHHGKNSAGHLYKGHGVVAANSSIPSKYQTIVTDNSDKKGFSSKSKRFQGTYLTTENPSPNNYIGHTQFVQNGTSFSKKGTGSFASKSKRGLRFGDMSSAPGPGIYRLPNMLTDRHDFNRSGYTSTFQQPIAQKTNKVSGNPAPNLYDVFKSNIGKSNNVSADAAFKSKSKREIINIAESRKFPAPWQYNVKDDITHSNARIPDSSFKSKTHRKIASNPTDIPGPGTYFSPEDEVVPNKVIFPKKHYLCISAPAMPLPKTPPLPGPGSYELVDFEGQPKHYMSGSAFVSGTSRWTSVDHSNSPGPAQYKPTHSTKQSFIYNATGRWVC